MDISFLKEYIAFSRAMNYAKTAQELFMAQPTLRAHIHALESELGIALVQKKGTRLFCHISRIKDKYLPNKKGTR